MRSYLCLVLLAMGSCATAPASRFPRLDEIFARFNGDAPGCAVGVFGPDGRTYSAGYGMADVEGRRPITRSSVFAVASVSKQFTAMAVMLQVREGRLSLDDSIRRAIKELPDSYEPITLRHLMTHTSGLPEYEQFYDRDGGPDYDSATRSGQLAVLAASVVPQRPPGVAAQYANTNYLLAAIAVERASGMPIEQYARTRIFDPLKMAHSGFVSTAGETGQSTAYPYDVSSGGTYKRVAYGAHLGPTGVRTSIADLQRWADNFQAPIVGDAQLLEQMQAPGALSSGASVTYGFGFESKQLGGFHAVLHSGVTVGTRAAFARFPQRRTSIALLCNRMDVNTERVVGQIAAVLFQ